MWGETDRFVQDGSTIVAKSNGSKFTVSRSFKKLLDTLPDDEVPSSVVLLGVLTDQVAPIAGDRGHLLRTAVDAVDEASPVCVDSKTVRAVEWLLAEVRNQISPERKRLIGRLVEQTGMNGSSPEIETSSRSSGSTGVQPSTGGEQSTNNRERSKTRRKSRSRRSKGLDDIAEELIGDRDFEITEDETSVVGEAKRKASNQQRDPAIDPALENIGDESDTTEE